MRQLWSCGVLASLSVVFAAPAWVAAADDTKKRPNILLVFTDDQSQRTLGCYQDEGAWPWVRTPHIDRLASEGVRFRSAYGAAWCAPARATLLTGLLPHGIRGLKATGIHETTYDPKQCRFWPAALRAAGYRTALIGKWHLGLDTGHGRDWDHSVVWDQGRSVGDQYNQQLYSSDGGPRQELRGYSTDLYTQFAVDFIGRDHDKPWFLWLCYNAPHMEWAVAERHRERYQDAEVPIPVDVFGPRKGKPRYLENYTAWQRDGERVLHQRTKQALPDLVRNYNRTICAVDEGIGRIRAALEKSGQLEQTLIVYTSDQGFAWGEHGFSSKMAPYDANMRMPLIVRLPGKARGGSVCAHPAALIDLPPTLLAQAGLPLPWPMHGHDLQPILNDPKASWDHPVLLEHFGWHYGAQTERGLTEDGAVLGVPWWLSLRQGKYKYIRTLVPDEIEELYDLESDPRELENLALLAAHGQRLTDFRQLLLAELTRTKAGLAAKLPRPRRLKAE